MTEPGGAAATETRAGETMQEFFALLGEVNDLGFHGFADLLDTAPADEVLRLLGSAKLVRASLQAYRTRVAAKHAPPLPLPGVP